MAVEEHGNCVATYNSGGFSYIYHEFGLGQDEANEHCQLHGGNLAVIHDDDTLMSIIKGLSVYRKVCNRVRDYLRIGLRKIDDGNYEWIDGSKLSVNANFSNKINNIRCSNFNSYCIAGSSTLDNLDVQCCNSELYFRYICQKFNELPQTSISITSPQIDISTASTNYIQESFTTHTPEVSTIPYLAIIGGISTLLACLTIVLMMVVFLKCRKLYKSTATKQLESENTNTTQQISEIAAVQYINVVSYVSDAQYVNLSETKIGSETSKLSPDNMNTPRCDADYANIKRTNQFVEGYLTPTVNMLSKTHQHHDTEYATAFNAYENE